jgi:hypothetical protein
MKAGDIVRVVRSPGGLWDDDDLRTKALFELCVGRCFPVVELDAGFVKLDVGKVMGQPSYVHTICIEPEFLELVEESN